VRRAGVHAAPIPASNPAAPRPRSTCRRSMSTPCLLCVRLGPCSNRPVRRCRDGLPVPACIRAVSVSASRSVVGPTIHNAHRSRLFRRSVSVTSLRATQGQDPSSTRSERSDRQRERSHVTATSTASYGEPTAVTLRDGAVPPAIRLRGAFKSAGAGEHRTPRGN
jgi:hypothetical protein